MMSMLTGEVRDIASLLPEDYFARLEQLVKKTDPETCGEFPQRCLAGALHTLNGSFHSMDWSPDGKYLAFGAMRDGISSDVYVYDIDTGRIRRVEYGPWNVVNISWSPDSQWILYEQLDYYDDTHGSWLMRDTLWTIRQDGTGLKKLPKPLKVMEWFSDNEYLAIGVWNAPGGYGIPTAVNVQTGYSHTGCYGYASPFPDCATVDPRSRLMVVISNANCDTGKQEGRHLYIGPAYGPLHRIPDPSELVEKNDLAGVLLRGGLVHPFVAVGMGIVGIGVDGTLDASYPEGVPNLSPTYWSISGLSVYDQSEKLRYSLSNEELARSPFGIISAWDTNSRGIFFQTEDAIYYWILEESAPRLIGSNKISSGFVRLYLAIIFNVNSIPHLRILPTRAAKPAEGASIWTQTSYKELFQPGTNRYDIKIPANSSWRWSFSLGTTDAEMFEKILVPEDVEFRINGQFIDPNMFRMTDQTTEGRFSRAWATMLSGWRSGDRAELEIRYTLRDAVRDGNVEYPAGEYRQIISVAVE